MDFTFFFVKVKYLFYESPEAASLPASLTTRSPYLAGWTTAITVSGDWEPSPAVSTQWVHITWAELFSFNEHHQINSPFFYYFSKVVLVLILFIVVFVFTVFTYNTCCSITFLIMCCLSHSISTIFIDKHRYEQKDSDLDCLFNFIYLYWLHLTFFFGWFFFCFAIIF